MNKVTRTEGEVQDKKRGGSGLLLSADDPLSLQKQMMELQSLVLRTSHPKAHQNHINSIQEIKVTM